MWEDGATFHEGVGRKGGKNKGKLGAMKNGAGLFLYKNDWKGWDNFWVTFDEAWNFFFGLSV